MAKPITNGGVMIGSTVSARNNFLYLKLERVATSANTSPKVVVIAPTNTARNNEFHAAPQPRLPSRQPNPHILGLKNLLMKMKE